MMEEGRVTLADLMVVLVEPSKTQQKIITGYFNEVGIDDVVSFETATEALAEMDKCKPDLVVSAMHLPDMTGVHLVEKLRDSEELEEVAYMLISSETQFRYLTPIRQAGVIAILPKPFEKTHLKEALKSTLDYVDPRFKEKDPSLEDVCVLLVDDSKTSRTFTKNVLEKMGITNFVEAVDGQDATELMNDKRFDLAIVDFNMPRMDGEELTDYIRTESHQPSLPILMLTSEQDGKRLSVIRNSGVSAVCDKLFDVASIYRLIVRLLEE
jgi:two-component system, chemotaxis family, chemotaxis protein CheY